MSVLRHATGDRTSGATCTQPAAHVGMYAGSLRAAQMCAGMGGCWCHSECVQGLEMMKIAD